MPIGIFTHSIIQRRVRWERTVHWRYIGILQQKVEVMADIHPYRQGHFRDQRLSEEVSACKTPVMFLALPQGNQDSTFNSSAKAKTLQRQGSEKRI